MKLIKYLGGEVRVKRGGSSIRTLAKHLGISPTTLSKIENGHIPDIKVLAVICDWLDVDVCIVKR